MIYKKIKGTNISASRICLGTDDFGTAVDKRTSFSIMDEYFDNGGNLLDTARIYAAWRPGGMGESERTIGEWIKSRKNRDKIIISTKCGHPPIDNMNIPRLAKAEILRDINDSLHALGTDYADVMWFHRDDINRPVEDIMCTVRDVIKSGKVRTFGVSNWTHGRIAAANRYAMENNMPQFAASQIKWSYAETSPHYIDDPTLIEMDDEQYSFYKQQAMPVFGYASQAKGFFSKYLAGGQAALSKKASERYLYGKNIIKFNKCKQLADNLGVSISAIVIAFITSCRDFDGYAIVGCKNTIQMKDSIRYSSLTLKKEDMEWLQNDSE